jgi:DNA-binding PadR family transcriptional regulator
MHRMARQQHGHEGLGRFGEPGVLILLSVSDGPKHGYAMTESILAETGIHLGPGTLYGSLSKLVDRGMIVALPSQDRRRPYEITDKGRTALAAQLQTWARVVKAGRAKLSPA